MIDTRYLRNIGAVTDAEQKLLQNKRIFLAGCGGLGGYLFSYLLRIGIGHITAIDCDSFEASNLNRQLLSSTEVLGQSKIQVAAAYASAVNPSVEVSVSKTRLTKENAYELMTGHDLVLDALDSIESRHILADACNHLHIPMIYGAIRGWTAQIGFFPSDKAPQRIRQLYPPRAELKDKSCLAFTPALCASVQTAEAVKYLLRKPQLLSDRLLYIDLLEQEFEEIPFFDE